VLRELDGHLPRPADWVTGPGSIAPDTRPWEQVRKEYAFVDEMDAIRPLVEGPGDVYICGECIDLCQSILEQERRRRGGTEDLPAILGLAEAVRELPGRLARNAELAPLRDALEAEVLSWSGDYQVIGQGLARLPNTSSLLLRGHSGESVQIALDLAGFAVSTGSACHSGSTKPSHAVTTLGYSEQEARSALRVSLLPGTAPDAVAALAAALKKILKK